MKNLYTLLIATILSITAMAQIPTNGLVAYYPFNGNANDESGNNHNGTINNLTLTNDRFGKPNSAYHFSGALGQIDINHFTPLNSIPITYTAWIRTNELYPNKEIPIINKYVAGSHNGYMIYLIGHGKLAAWYFQSTSNYIYSDSTSISINDNHWHFIAATFDSTELNIFIDSIKVLTTNWSSPNPGPCSTNQSLIFGNYPGGSGIDYVGDMDDVSIYNRRLTDIEIKDFYNCTAPTTCVTNPPIVINGSRCGAGSVTLHASNGISYSWYDASMCGNLVNVGSAFITPSLDSTRIYYVTNTDSCESVRVPVTAYINNLKITGNNKTISCGDTVTLNTITTYNGSHALTYSWTPITGLSSASIANPVASPGQTTTYTVMVSDSVCSSYSNITVTVNTANFGVNFSSNTQLLYSPPFAIQFTNSTPNISDYNFTWYFGDGSSQQSNNVTVFHQYNQNGTYDVTLVATNIATGCAETLFKSGYLYCAGGTACSQTAIINPTGPITACAGTPVTFTCNTVAGATYQWNYNGAIISGATTTTYNANASGNYSATVILNGCPVTSSVVTVTLSNPPTAPVITSKGSLIYCSGGKDTLTATAGAASYLWSNGATTQSTVVTTSGNYTVQITDANGCSSQSQPYLVGASPLANPDICIVGVDSVSGHNIVIWNKPVSTAIKHYNVYSQGNQANVFNLLGSVPYSSMSTFIDTASKPTQQAYIYKISVVDTCGAESSLSNYHETIHLSINQGMGNTYNLMWNFYEGFTFPSYKIYRGTSPSNMTLLTTLASTLNSYTDQTPPTGYVYYQIEAVNPNPCTPSKKVVNSSKSNIASNNVATGIYNYVDNAINISIYPDPATDKLTIDASQSIPKSIEILNIEGQIIKVITGSSNKTNVDISELPSGLYFVKVQTEKGIAVKKFIKE